MIDVFLACITLDPNLMEEQSNQSKTVDKKQSSKKTKLIEDNQKYLDKYVESCFKHKTGSSVVDKMRKLLSDYIKKFNFGNEERYNLQII